MAGFNFRGSSGYVTDAAGDVYVLYGDAYPTVRGGATFGYETTMVSVVGTRDRSSSVDPRLAGMHYVVGGGPVTTFRVDLPAAGDYDIRAAFGDALYSHTSQQNYELADDVTSFQTISTGMGAGQFCDATGVVRGNAALWVANNEALSHTFSSTVLRLKYGGGPSDTVVAHLAYEATGGEAVLLVDGASHAVSSDSVTLSQVHDLTIGSAAHAQTADAVGITQNHVLSVAAALHAQTADNAGLGQNHVISADNSAHGQSAGTASIAQNQILGVQGAAHGQIAANIEIEVAGSLAPDGARHSHVAGTVTLVQNHSVAIDGAIQPQTSGAAELSLFSHIAPANVMQAHSAGNVTLSQVHALSVQDARHGQAASGPDVFEAISVPVDSATHGITSDTVDIAQQHVLDVAGCSHAHSAETVILAQVHFLATTFAQHAQLADNVTVTPISDAAPTDRTIGIPDDRRSTVRVGPRPVINVTSSR